jgi:myo-inositol-1(or 4)-monophosphatase
MALSANINVMLRAAEKAAKSLVRDFGEVEQLQVSRKGPGDFVSAADHRAEEIIYGELSKARPDFGFLMEERGEVKAAAADAPRWIVDPLDGTTNFLHGIPHWCISIALEDKGEIIAGVIHDPIKDETFRAEKGTGAFMRNKRLRVSGRTTLDAAVIATGAPKRAKDDQQLFLREYEAVQSQAPGLRRFGAAALDLAYVAAGRYEAFWERHINAWDMAAGYLIVREAGGKATQISGKDGPVFTNNILASNATLHEQVRQILAEAAVAKKDAA